MNEPFNPLNIQKQLDAITLPNISLQPGTLPSRKTVIRFLKVLLNLMFPKYFHLSPAQAAPSLTPPEETILLLQELVKHSTGTISEDDLQSITQRFFSLLPEVKQLLTEDALAIYEGDPAAKSYEEIFLCYPGFFAIAIHRIAHILYGLSVPLLPRIMSEYAHEKTGIDIHPGATIGRHFCIDHGTGIVIGETCTIGDRVKLYQGVTLGARSFAYDEGGRLLKGNKRHPQIGNDVVIYANAVILGGDTYIGDHCTIGGNVWLTESLSEGTVIYYTAENRTRTKTLG